jgi:hypothetical protein
MKEIGVTAVKSCFDESVTNRLAGANAVPFGQFGKAFRNEKAATNPNASVDQIDTRGIWGDKYFAVDMLLERRLGYKSLDDVRGNYLDSTTFMDTVIDPKTGTPVKGSDGKAMKVEKTYDVMMTRVIDSFLMNEVTAFTNIYDESGSVLGAMKYNFFPHENHWIPYQRGIIGRLLDLSSDDVPFAEMMLSQVLSNMPDTTENSVASAMRDYYGIQSYLGNGDRVADFVSYDLGDATVYANKQKNAFSVKILERLAGISVLEKLTASWEKLTGEERGARLTAVIAAAKKGVEAVKPEPKVDLKNPKNKKPKESKSDLSPEEIAATKIPVDVLELYQANKLDDREYYELVLRMVLRANRRANSSLNYR